MNLIFEVPKTLLTSIIIRGWASSMPPRARTCQINFEALRPLRPSSALDQVVYGLCVGLLFLADSFLCGSRLYLSLLNVYH